MEELYICDIDGTLSDFRHHRGPFEEDKVIDDIPLATVEVIKALITSGKRIMYFSGRTDKCYEDSCKWIEEHVGQKPELYMRQQGDWRSDEIVKKELYEKHIEGKYRVLGVFDDRLKVCRMWYDLKLFVFNCNQGLIDF